MGRNKILCCEKCTEKYRSDKTHECKPNSKQCAMCSRRLRHRNLARHLYQQHHFLRGVKFHDYLKENNPKLLMDIKRAKLGASEERLIPIVVREYEQFRKTLTNGFTKYIVELNGQEYEFHEEKEAKQLFRVANSNKKLIKIKKGERILLSQVD